LLLFKFFRYLWIMKPFGTFLSVFIITLSVFFTSCRQPSGSGKKVFRYNEAAGITSLDPSYSNRVENIWAITQIFNGLVQLDEQLEPAPCLAKSWDIDSSGTRYIFHLHDSILFHENTCFGEKKTRFVVAQDVVFSFNRIAAYSGASPGMWVFSVAKRYDDGSLYCRAIDDRTFEIELKEPFAPFLKLLSMPYCSVVAPEAVKHYGKDFRRNPVGTGPFFLANWYEGEKMILLRNNNYFEVENGVRLPFLDALSISFLKDRQSAFLEFVKGRFDFISGIDGSYKDEILGPDGSLNPRYESKVNFKKVPYLKTDYLGFNLSDAGNNPLPDAYKNPLVRKAVSLAIDREKLIRFLRNNIGHAAVNGFVPRGINTFDSTLSLYPYNPQEAALLLERAGYPQGKGIPEISLLTTAAYQDMCEFVQNQLSQVGIKIKVENVLPAVHSEWVSTGKSAFFRKSWVGDYADAENFMMLYTSELKSPSGPNYTHYSSALADSYYHQAVKITDEKKRIDLYHKMEKLVADDCPVIPLFYDEVVYFTAKDVVNLKANPLNFPEFKRVDKNIEP
jgi:ABC-type transport system substrate-binding protein